MLPNPSIRVIRGRLLFKIRILNTLFILSESALFAVQVFCRGCRVCCEILGSTPVSGVGEGVPPPSRTSHKKFRRRDTQRPTRRTRMLPNPIIRVIRG